MPSTTRRHLRDVRRRFTGEDKATAEAGISRGTHGLDTCKPEQRRFRALLALHLFNFLGHDQIRPETACISSSYGFLSYSMVASPRYDHILFIIPPAVENAVTRLMPGKDDLGRHMPGLRVVASDYYYNFHLIHLPTKARIILARQPNYKSADKLANSRPLWTAELLPHDDIRLSTTELRAIESIPPMTAAIETLLAGLVSRLNTRDPEGKWSIDCWWGDYLMRPKPEGFDHSRENVTLWGSGSKWELRWSSHPYAEDIVASLTHPEIGVEGASATRTEHGWHITLHDSKLSLRYGNYGGARL